MGYLIFAGLAMPLGLVICGAALVAYWQTEKPRLAMIAIVGVAIFAAGGVGGLMPYYQLQAEIDCQNNAACMISRDLR